MFASAEDDLSSSSSASNAEGPNVGEMLPKEMRFFDGGPKEHGFSMEHSKDGHFSDLEHPLPCSPPREGMFPSHKHYHCRMCDQEFENKSDMQRHAKDTHRMDEKSHKCQNCLKSFPSSQQLSQHLLVHTNVRKYACKFCDKMFKQLSHVQQHLRIHTGERPYRCPVEMCPKSFRQLSSLQQHIKGHNMPLPKSYPISKTSFPRFSNQVIARPHDLICQVCEKHCENDSSFFQHLQQQHPDYWKVLSGEHQHPPRCKGEEVFVCPSCALEFAGVGELRKHQDREHPDEHINDANFNICVCQKIYNNDLQFLKHLEGRLDREHEEKYKEVQRKLQQPQRIKHLSNGRSVHAEEEETYHGRECGKRRFEEGDEEVARGEEMCKRERCEMNGRERDERNGMNGREVGKVNGGDVGGERGEMNWRKGYESGEMNGRERGEMKNSPCSDCSEPAYKGSEA